MDLSTVYLTNREQSFNEEGIVNNSIDMECKADDAVNYLVEF